MARLSRDDIACRVPHAGAMVLLDAVTAWDTASITCTARSHRAADNPLRQQRLSVLAGIEYAAQAMALHGSLSSGENKQRRVLGTVRNVRACADFLDDLGSELTVEVGLLGQTAAGAQYTFRLRDGAREVLSGEATVFAS